MRTRDESSVEGLELELKVDHTADLEAAPSCTASSIPEGVVPDEEEDDQHHSGIRGMTVAFQVLLGRWCAGGVVHPRLSPPLKQCNWLLDHIPS